MVPADNLAIRLMDSLYQAGQLNPSNKVAFEKYREANRVLLGFANTDIKTLNSLAFETVNTQRQHLQHHKIAKVSNSEDVFARRFITKPDCQKNSYREGYQL